jgi:hypothetical protein
LEAHGYIEGLKNQGLKQEEADAVAAEVGSNRHTDIIYSVRILIDKTISCCGMHNYFPVLCE